MKRSTNVTVSSSYDEEIRMPINRLCGIRVTEELYFTGRTTTFGPNTRLHQMKIEARTTINETLSFTSGTRVTTSGDDFVTWIPMWQPQE
ncbi:hypothetical protein F2Q68_00025662 [Brassica cretica]|uniref:Uncharacterized protein n=1 Tax=Brassica cretica TaxID=69181 RepID=A0A8S9I8X4_BRACR|nr:hypothetical protein F2Q68_00025662 [Brassica cretica]